MTPMSWHRLAIGSAALVTVAAACAFVGLMRTSTSEATSRRSSSELVTDKQIRDTFEKHRTAFEELKTLILVEKATHSIGLAHIGHYTWFRGRWENLAEKKVARETDVLKDNGLTPERYEQYTALLESIGALDVWSTTGHRGVATMPVQIWWPTISVGFSIAGWSKKVVFDPELAEQPMVANTDEAFAREPRKEYLSHLDDSWYIVRNWR